MFGNRNNSGGGKVCQFFLEGRCKFGDSCKNEHPRNQGAAQNRFAPLQDGSNNSAGGRGRSGAFAGGDRYRPGQSNNQSLPYYLSYDSIKADLTPSDQGGERPSWPLSSYGPGRDAPRQLLEGAVEQSFEEVRLQYYTARASGNEQAYIQNEQGASAQANQQAEKVLNDLEGAVKFVIDGENQHPNRLDQVIKNSGPFRTGGGSTFGQSSQPSAFGGASATGGSAFGQPSSFGGQQQSSAFGQPSALGGQTSAFGQPSAAGGSSAFGQPSTMGQKPAFGQASGPGSTGSAFGQPSTPGSGASAFGQSSSLGGGSSAFGQPSSLGGQKPAFGQASTPAFGQSGFGQAAKPAFGAPSQPASAFGQASALGNGQAPQASPSPFAAAANRPSPFAQAASNTPAQPSSGFGQPSALGGGAQQPQPSPFGQPSAFGQQQQQSTPFGQASNNNGAASPFGGTGSGQSNNNPFAAKPASTPAFGQPSQPTNNAFGQPSQPAPSPFGQAAQQSGNSTFGQSNANTAQPTQPASGGADAEGPPEAYTGELGAMLKEVYEYVKQTGEFKDGIMPEIPPKREWVVPVA